MFRILKWSYLVLCSFSLYILPFTIRGMIHRQYFPYTKLFSLSSLSQIFRGWGAWYKGSWNEGFSKNIIRFWAIKNVFQIISTFCWKSHIEISTGYPLSSVFWLLKMTWYIEFLILWLAYLWDVEQERGSSLWLKTILYFGMKIFSSALGDWN